MSGMAPFRFCRFATVLSVVLLIQSCFSKGDLSDRNDHGDLDHLFGKVLDEEEFRVDVKGRGVAVDLKQNEWVESENIARIANIENQNEFYMPVLVNLVFVGFSGKGKHGFNISQPVLADWFEHLAHDTPYSLVDVLDEDLSLSEDETANYRYFFDILELDERIDAVLVDLLRGFMRNEDKSFYERRMRIREGKSYSYIDGRRVSRMLQDVAIGLNINNSYTFFILNLDLGTDEKQVYGYRAGLSQHEISELQQASLSKDAGYAPDHFPTAGEVRPERKREGIDDKVRVRSSKTVALSDAWIERFVSKQHNPITNLTLVDYFSEIARNGGEEERHLLDQVIAPSSTIYEDCLVDMWTGTGRQMLIDLSAGPFEWGPTSKGKGIRTPDIIPRVEKTMKLLKHEQPEVKDEVQEKPLTAQLRGALSGEKDVAMEFYKKYCSTTTHKPPFCLSLEKRMEQMDKAGSSASGESLSAAVRDFGIISADQRGADANHPALDSFISQLGAVISKGISQVITPTSTAPRVYARDKVTIELYIICNHKTYKPTSMHNFDLVLFRSELNRIKLPKQDFSFVIHRVKMDEDPVLSVAFASALKTDMVGAMDARGRFYSQQRTYIDSVQFRRHLSLTSEILDNDQTSSRALRIPIFLFSLDHPYPVLVDKYYQAQALGSMVIAVQSPQLRWETNLMCNSIPIFWNLRNPTKATLAAVLQIIGGVNSYWLGSGSLKENEYKDWVWSVGAHALSFTSHRAGLSTITIDAIHRNYIMNAMASSIKTVSTANKLLEKEKTTPENYGAFQILPLDDINALHLRILRLRATVIALASEGKLDKAIAISSHLLARSQEYAKLAQDAATLLETYECVKADTIDLISPIMISLDIVILILLILLRQRKSKVKLN